MKLFTTRLFILFFILFSSTILLKVVGNEGRNGENNRVAKSVSKSWAKIKSILHAAQMKYYPPNLDFRSQGKITENAYEGSRSSTAEKVNKRVKLAVEKSLEDGEMTMEETAQTAAKLMGEAMHKAKDKVEHKITKRKEDEL
ncbi:hypothetical protein RND81_06G019000 [Saponaria officinalis]|uniref:Uncharacterized protein n=1 Tax=Saponaria officinalis TaxID=3572 RepID=A0AAW1K7U6_SAPOF